MAQIVNAAGDDCLAPSSFPIPTGHARLGAPLRSPWPGAPPQSAGGVLLASSALGHLRRRHGAACLDPGLRRQHLPVHRRARRATTPTRPPRSTPPTAGSSPTSGSSGGPWCRSKEMSPCVGPPSSPPRTSASTSTTGSTGTASSARSRPTSCKFRSPKGSPPSPCSWPATSGPRTSAAGTSRSSARCARSRWPREIEAKYPKDKILELYLNQIDLGNRAFGVEAASQRYFGKSVARPERGRGGDAGGHPQGARPATTRAGIPRLASSAATW